ncbi:ATP-dependent dethiobiotin synthetase BioD [Candidatus Magnetomoraceae bacterium gMMP-1]
MNSENFFITGTDTGVGKTVISLLLMQFLNKKGYNPFYIKPMQTGCKDPYDTDSDAKFIYNYIKELKQLDPADSVIYCFKNPKAPWFAARDDGKNIDFKVIEKNLQKKSNSYSPIIIEGAGGLFVPIDEKFLMIDAIQHTNTGVILVARAGLGTINHTLLSLEALSSRSIKPKGIVFVDAGDQPTPEDMINENIEAVEKFSGIKISGIIEKIDDFSNPRENCYRVIEELII